MSFQLQGGNAASNDYDYQSGSGMDNFMSRSLDEVSWQANLNTTYNTLSNLPIGISPTTATPTNYDATQLSGSQGDAYNLGGIQMSGQNSTITLNSGSIQVNG